MPWLDEIGRSLLVVASTLLLLPISGSALADQPNREFLSAEDVVLEDICDFDVAVKVVENKELLTTFFKDGDVTREIVNGRLVVELVNLETEEIVVANISGPGTFTTEGETLTIDSHGPWIHWFFPGELGVGDPGAIILTNGRVVVQFGTDGAAILSASGRQRDDCLLLAA